VVCDNCEATKPGEDPLDAIEAADRAGWRLVEMAGVTSQLCLACVQARVNEGAGVTVWRLCDEFARRLAGKPRRELPLTPPRVAVKEVVIHAAMMSSASVLAPEYLDQGLPLSWWMRRHVRTEPLNTARQVAIVLLGELRWKKSKVARSFGRSPAAFSWAARAVRDRAEVDKEFRAQLLEAERRFHGALKLMRNGGRL
jgi:hypothetical protein